MKDVLQGIADGRRPRLLATSALTLAIFVVQPGIAIAQDDKAPRPGEARPPAANAAPASDEIVVTANRREEAISKLPFNISAFGGEDLRRSQVGDVTQLTQQVPNFVIQDIGARGTATSIPIIRGLNASDPALSSARRLQSPVGFYLGNAPVTGALPFFDLKRVEVLRGPQGTLYGAGALSGAIRVMPEEPALDAVAGYASGGLSATRRSDDVGYAFEGAFNLPIASTLALRVAGRYEKEPGFIDMRDVIRREDGSYTSGVPVLADPDDVVGSQAVYFDKEDESYARSWGIRASLKWSPSPEFDATASYSHSFQKGSGGPYDNPEWEGGPSPLNPAVILQPTGDYEFSALTLEPFQRRSEMASLDMSYDLGFATLSSTLTYGRTNGTGVTDSTKILLGTNPDLGFLYTGFPGNPRTVLTSEDKDRERTFSEEIRLVSASGGTFDYIVGAFFQQQKRRIGLRVFAPGADSQSAAANGGDTTPVILGGGYVPLFPDGSTFIQDDLQRFRDYSFYGELTAHLTDAWQVTGGARVFHQTFSQRHIAESTLLLFADDETTSNKVTSQIFKINTSYQLDAANQIYATWSQGFRRGGSNSFTMVGDAAEPAALIPYTPDKTNNFEVGLKGVVGGVRYAANLFYIDWNRPQIDLLTPYNLAAVVVNGSKASSKGVEVEMTGPILFEGLSITAGAAYAKARLTRDFSLPAGDGVGGIIADGINGKKGDRLPGAPDFSGSITLAYDMPLSDRSNLNLSFGADFRSSTLNQLQSLNPDSPTRRAPGYALFRGSVTFEIDDWSFQLYANNLFDRRAVMVANARTSDEIEILGDWGNYYVINRPREIGFTISRAF